ncbi:MAG TPA: uroporphyrinogen decarboxylase family protein [Planctomycetota bacterium]|nr:uroporphyrinogen decarboxylase family protein [Planctomycetota bacterium]HUW58548.1 uroporphyrinogen decarboxylase family protein [Planctomycetota bacterium]
MNSRERFLAALSGEETDRAPLAHVSALTTLELQETTGCAMPEVHHDPEKLVRLCGANHDLLGFDAVTFNINYFGEPAALGARMNWGAPDTLPTYTSNPWREPDDAAVPNDLLDRPPVSTYLEALRIACKTYGDRCAVLGKVMGPFSMTLAMHGIENVMLACVDDPAKIRHFLDVSAGVLVRCANAEFDAGADAVAIGEGGAGANMMSPAMYDTLLADVHRKMLRRIHGPTIMHICGDITPRLNSLKTVGLTCFNFDWAIKPIVMKDAADDQFRIMGNVNTTDLMLGPPEKIEEQVSACLNAGVDIISPGCAVSPKCPNANLKAMSDTIVKWHES